MVVNSSPFQYLTQVASFLKVPGGKIGVSNDNLPTRVSGKSTTTGHFNIISQLFKEASSDLEGSSELERAQVRQWIEYGIVYGNQAETAASVNQILKELNSVLATRTYLVSQKLTIADVFLYYILFNIVENLSILEKENYLHVSRWFDNLQQNSSIRQSNKIIDFSTTYLVNFAPTRH